MNHKCSNKRIKQLTGSQSKIGILLWARGPFECQKLIIVLSMAHQNAQTQIWNSYGMCALIIKSHKPANTFIDHTVAHRSPWADTLTNLKPKKLIFLGNLLKVASSMHKRVENLLYCLRLDMKVRWRKRVCLTSKNEQRSETEQKKNV